MVRVRVTITCLVLFMSDLAIGQVAVVSPLPAGILQVRGDHANLHIHFNVPKGFQHFGYKLSSDIDTSKITDGWSEIAILDTLVDTLITVPRSLRNYTLYWRIDSSGIDTGGLIGNLTPGHIIGIAGQSNAQGYCYEMVESPWGDIRMLRNLTAWEPAKEPTGNVAGGPWIVMANRLYDSLQDSLPIGIVNVAVGGSGIMVASPGGQWIRNDANPLDSSDYGLALNRFLHAGSELECLCWIQGEAEAGYSLHAFDPEEYRVTFQGLMNRLKKDLGTDYPIFHLQVGGWSGTSAAYFREVHEAERILPPSTLVGTGLGRAVEAVDGVHYNVPSLWAVGGMFADAILAELYDKPGSMYPPLMPDSIAKFDSVLNSDGSKELCISLGWTRGGQAVKLGSMHEAQEFELEADGQVLDTSKVWYRILAPDSQRVLIGLRSGSIDPNLLWKVTYNATVGADFAPLATINPISGDTIFATAFYRLPVNGSLPTLSVREFKIDRIVPTPSQQAIHCYILALHHQAITLDVRDSRGALMRSVAVVLEEGQQDIPIPIEGLANGDYWVVLSDGVSNSVEKAVVIR